MTPAGPTVRQSADSADYLAVIWSAMATASPPSLLGSGAEPAVLAAAAWPSVPRRYVIACPTYADKNKADLVKGYLTYLLGTDGQAAAAKTAGSAPLPSKLGGDAVAIADQITAK